MLAKVLIMLHYLIHVCLVFLIAITVYKALQIYVKLVIVQLFEHQINSNAKQIVQREKFNMILRIFVWNAKLIIAKHVHQILLIFVMNA